MNDCMAKVSETEKLSFISSVEAKFLSKTEYISGDYSQV